MSERVDSRANRHVQALNIFDMAEIQLRFGKRNEHGQIIWIDRIGLTQVRGGLFDTIIAPQVLSIIIENANAPRQNCGGRE